MCIPREFIIATTFTALNRPAKPRLWRAGEMWYCALARRQEAGVHEFEHPIGSGKSATVAYNHWQRLRDWMTAERRL